MPRESATGLQGSWHQCSEPKEIRVNLGETRQGAKCRAGGAGPSKPASPAVGVRTDVPMENRCSLGLNVGQGVEGAGEGGRGGGSASAGKRNVHRCSFII